jgi:hypothetical protein
MTKIATTFRLMPAVLALCALPALAAAQTGESVGGFAGFANYDYISQTTTMSPTAPAAVPVVVYDNTLSAALYGVSSTQLTATWGDELLTTNTGLLSEMMFSIFNSGSSAGPLLTGLFAITFYDAATSANLGGFTANFNFGAGLAPGYFTIGNVTGLDYLGINLGVSDVIVTQALVSRTGTASRMGIVSLSPPTVGTSPTSMYISASTIGGGVPGFYTFTNGPADPGYRVTLMNEPVPTTKTTWGRVKSLYR